MKPMVERDRRAVSASALLLAGCGLMACGEVVSTAPVPAVPTFGPSVVHLSPEQRRWLAQTVPAEALVTRPATQQELQAFRDRFPPGELQALLAVVNRRAADRGEDTIPHCVPLCGPTRVPGP